MVGDVLWLPFLNDAIINCNDDFWLRFQYCFDVLLPAVPKERVSFTLIVSRCTMALWLGHFVGYPENLLVRRQNHNIMNF
jgi:hypothetical protein